MADLIVTGGKPLSGTIIPSGNKNSALPIVCATLLTDEPVTITNVPAITDLDKIVAFMTQQGSKVEWDKAAYSLAKSPFVEAVLADLRASGRLA